MYRSLRAVFDAVHAKMAFGNPKGFMGITSAVTVCKAFFAVGAKIDVSPYSEKWA